MAWQCSSALPCWGRAERQSLRCLYKLESLLGLYKREQRLDGHASVRACAASTSLGVFLDGLASRFAVERHPQRGRHRGASGRGYGRRHGRGDRLAVVVACPLAQRCTSYRARHRRRLLEGRSEDAHRGTCTSYLVGTCKRRKHPGLVLQSRVAYRGPRALCRSCGVRRRISPLEMRACGVRQCTQATRGAASLAGEGQREGRIERSQRAEEEARGSRAHHCRQRCRWRGHRRRGRRRCLRRSELTSSELTGRPVCMRRERWRGGGRRRRREHPR